MPLRELGELLGDLSGVAQKSRRIATMSKRAAKNFQRMAPEEKAALGKRAIGKAVMYIADCLAGPEIEVRQ